MPDAPETPRPERPLQAVRRSVVAALARIGIAVVSRLPLPLARGLGTVLGGCGYFLNGRERGRALAHLALAFPDRPAAWHRRTARAVFRHFGRSAAEYIRVIRWPPAERARLCVNYDDFRRTAEQDARDGPGVLTLTAHLGAWELLGAIGVSYLPLTVVARRPPDPRLARLADALRARAGVGVVYQDQSPRELLRALKRGEMVGILADQDVRRIPGVFVPFFGTDAWTPTAPVEIARASGATLRLYVLVREGARYRAIWSERLAVPPKSAGAEGLRAATLAWSRLLEAQIRARPEQWVWMHRRWRTRPDSGAAGGASASPESG